MDAELYVMVRWVELDRPSIRRRMQAQEVIEASSHTPSLRYRLGPLLVALGLGIERFGRWMASAPQPQPLNTE